MDCQRIHTRSPGIVAYLTCCNQADRCESNDGTHDPLHRIHRVGGLLSAGLSTVLPGRLFAIHGAIPSDRDPALAGVARKSTDCADYIEGTVRVRGDASSESVAGNRQHVPVVGPSHTAARGGRGLSDEGPTIQAPKGTTAGSDGLDHRRVHGRIAAIQNGNRIDWRHPVLPLVGIVSLFRLGIGTPSHGPAFNSHGRRATRTERVLLSSGESEGLRSRLVPCLAANGQSDTRDLRRTPRTALATRSKRGLATQQVSGVYGIGWNLRPEGRMYGVPSNPKIYGVLLCSGRIERSKEARAFFAKNHGSIPRPAHSPFRSFDRIDSSPTLIDHATWRVLRQPATTTLSGVASGGSFHCTADGGSSRIVEIPQRRWQPDHAYCGRHVETWRQYPSAGLCCAFSKPCDSAIGHVSRRAVERPEVSWHGSRLPRKAGISHAPMFQSWRGSIPRGYAVATRPPERGGEAGRGWETPILRIALGCFPVTEGPRNVADIAVATFLAYQHSINLVCKT